MIKILLVDDEPFIRKGIQILIDWEKYGYKIIAEASNGVEAIKELEKNEIDLIITDIKMPEMNGLEFIEYTKRNINKEYKFMVLSGFYEFEYAKKAIRYDVKDYILKPISKDELIKVLINFRDECIDNKIKLDQDKIKDKALFDKKMISVISGKYDNSELDYAKKYLNFNGTLRYIGIEINYDNMSYIENEKKREDQYKLYEVMIDFLKENYYHVLFDVSKEKNCYDIGFIYNKKLAQEYDITEREYILMIQTKIKEALSYEVYMYIGQKVKSIEELFISYKSANVAKIFTGFSNITYYDDTMEKKEIIYGGEKQFIDNLIKEIEENNEIEIKKCVDILYQNFKLYAADMDIIKMDINYLLCSLINIAKNLDSESNQKEVLKYITDGAFEKMISRGSSDHLKEFSLEFSKYLNQLRGQKVYGILSHIEKDIFEGYADKISLKSLSEKYYVNSAYLGQLFKKKYKMNFNDYLNAFRIEKAVQLLSTSDKKIYEISNIVGYSNTDYFINKFVQLKGTTPSQYRRKLIESIEKTK